MLFVQPLIRLWSVIMSSNAKLNLLLPLLIACDASFLPEKSLADNPEDLTDVQIQELINSSGMNQMEAEAVGNRYRVWFNGVFVMDYELEEANINDMYDVEEQTTYMRDVMAQRQQETDELLKENERRATTEEEDKER